MTAAGNNVMNSTLYQAWRAAIAERETQEMQLACKPKRVRRRTESSKERTLGKLMHSHRVLVCCVPGALFTWWVRCVGNGGRP